MVVQRISLPIHVTAAGNLASVAQDSPVEIARSVQLLISTRPGERRSAPDYGVADMLGIGIDPDAIADAAAAWEPRADPADIELIATGAEEAARVFPAQPATTTAEEA